ncbi:MAG TPA: phosphate acyltransferase PlsX [Firmicutes bacterium]|nr:phosphate acyltransferase PlsX [Bacillota bacterium]
MVKVAVDAMGGDHAPAEIIAGTISALSIIEDLQVILVGKRGVIENSLAGFSYPQDRLSIIHAEEMIAPDDDPGLSIRRKKNSSMVRALEMVRSGEADAALSAGNTGALMAGGLLFLGRLGKISRPALLTAMPSFGDKPVLFLDVGANMDARPGQLLQYAMMGRIYAQQIISCPAPKVALFNVGTEPKKGNQQVKKAYPLLEKYLPDFYGNIEGTDVFFGRADVVVCDGFVGNIFLKTSEGLSRAILGYFKNEIPRSLRYKIGAALLRPVFLSLREKIDDSGYGGALLMGVNGLCIKCHGSSKARSIEQALIKQVYPFVCKKVTNQLQDAMELLSSRLAPGDDN